ncbi:MAG TPA: flagellar basal-body MS-ring/collar protein FliF [Anaeromyxobacteraceae bacterium]|nr:flagellar basal-body MS-ring/collar protein FliF [Anaeromyxobacteraceae bacterium]
MDPLTRQLHALPSRLGALPLAVKVVLAAALLALVAAGSLFSASSAESYQYAFTNLTAEDSAEAAGQLKAAGVPFRLEAAGSALAVPANKVHDARLLLAAAGLPRGGGVGFELFDKGDLGVSEFTQRVNLRRATEGELARTISRLGPVRAARVHVTLPEKTLFKEDARKASAAVVVTLQPGRLLGEREISGIRHLVSSAVPGLSASDVTLVDGRGAVLSESAQWAESGQYQRKLERDLEQRVVELLEQAVGAGGVVVRVAASVDASEVTESAERVDPDTSALRSERTVTQSSSQDASATAGVAGAAANQPLAPVPAAPGSVNRGSSSMTDEVRNYDVSRTQTTTVTRAPRLKRLSVAVLVDGVDGKPRPEAEVRRLGDLAKAAVGFDATRGDELDISSSPFTRSDEGAEPAAQAPSAARPAWLWPAAGGAGALVLALLALLLLRRRAPAQASAMSVVLTPGATVAQLEAAASRAAGALPPAPDAARAADESKDPLVRARQRARTLATDDPNRTAKIIKHWMRETETHGS